MTEQDQPGPASPGTEEAAQHTGDDNLSAEDTVALLAQAPENESEGAAGHEDASQPSDEELTETVAGLDLDNLTENDWQGIADHLNSRGADRIAGLIKERSELRSALEAREKQEEDPLARPPDPESNPYREIETVEELQAKAAEVDEMIEWADNLTEENEDTHNDAIVHEEDGREYTLREIKSMLRSARKARSTHLKNRYQELQGLQQIEAERQQARQIAEDEFAWMKEEENPIRQRWEGVMAHPGLQALKDEFPEIPLVLAHAADSIHRSEQRKAGKAPTAKRQQSRMRPPENPSAGTAAPAKQVPGPAKGLEDLHQQFASTGNYKVLEEILSLQSE